MSYFLNCSGITEENYDQIISKREKFQSYPYYLKHTIFLEDVEIHKVRLLDFEERIEATHENIKKANLLFQNEKSLEALTLYERVIIFKF